ncbi:MAG TPA: polyprenol monophosphomannose synthase [Ignavibacteria bacterium]|nr:dolichyl-phosphate beta-D-mannosyltransferase [Bacteroidota bacterium]HRE11513.1 polyprenol monophosphomannose synthase [Ignavibacteria bacterium]HRF66642.1 polyprenol monophosphomannose synthase [Ignavibacteria bacterium]HRJ04496.1 polyprenol monophosphomannose synthase [Ignavibacteria bacterium]
MKRALIIIPTYNEAENIVNIINELLALVCGGVSIDILVVDDNSTDGTAMLVKNLNNQRIHIIERPGKMGLGTAYIRGFKYAIEHSYDYVFEMDADFSHDPDAVPAFFDKLKEYDVVIGSRYIEGIAVVNWPLSRLMISIGASYYTRMITFLPVKDVTAGFMAYRVDSLKQIDFDKVHSNGYSFQIEMKFRMWKKGFKLVEIPIVFIDRRAGVSKMSRKIVYEAMFMVWKLKLKSIFNKL